MSKHNSFEGAAIFGEDHGREQEHHVFLDSKILEKYQAEFGNVFSIESLFRLAEGDKVLMHDVESLIALSHIYAGDVMLLQDLADTDPRNESGAQGLLDRQQESHSKFIEALAILFTHANERGIVIPFELYGASRIKFSQIALFIAYDDEHSPHSEKLAKSA